MDIWQDLQSTMNQGLDISRDLFHKAQEKAKDLGERGILTLEIKQLEMQLEKVSCKLGADVYLLFTTSQKSEISRSDGKIDELVKQLHDIEEKIKQRQALLNK